MLAFWGIAILVVLGSYTVFGWAIVAFAVLLFVLSGGRLG
jgi:hypothetical protein